MSFDTTYKEPVPFRTYLGGCGTNGPVSFLERLV